METNVIAIWRLDAERIGMLPHKLRSSRGGAPLRLAAQTLAGLLVLPVAPTMADSIRLSPSETQRIGRKVWQNECQGTVAGLTSWNPGEDFASLGIGHFIWYPKGVQGPFDESFPRFVGFAENHQAKFPKGINLKGACPWNSRGEFERASQSPTMKELRQFLASTVDLQAKFLVSRLVDSLPRILDAAEPSKRNQVQQRFAQLAKSPTGCYALVDYVNFKGEGVLATERYAGQGWGLLQVLEGMSQETTDRNPVKSFSESAKRVLSVRVRNAPAGRNEARWLPGWIRRVNTYSQD